MKNCAVRIFCGMLVVNSAFAYDWGGKTGRVVLTETAEVEQSDAETVAGLTGIVLSGSDTKIIFKNTSALTLAGSLTGDGQIVKRGAGDLIFSNVQDQTIAKVHNCCADYYTKGGIVVEHGTLTTPQNGTSACYYGPVTVSNNAEFVLLKSYATHVDALEGEGTVSCAYAGATTTESPTLWIGYYGENRPSRFSGKLVGYVSVQVCSDVRFAGSDSTYNGETKVYRNDYTSAEDRGVLRLCKFGMRNSPSSVGKGDSYQYRYDDILLTFGGCLSYEGVGETTDKRISICHQQCFIDRFIDAGPLGGVTFTGSWIQGDKYFGHCVLRGSNTQDMVIAGMMRDSNLANAGSTLYKKRGSGTWRLAENVNRTNAGAWFVEEGTLKFDSIAEIGEVSSLGLSTMCYKDASCGDPATYKTPENLLPYEIKIGATGSIPTLEYSGSNVWSGTTTRRIAITGDAARIRDNSMDGKVALLGGVSPVPGETGVKTLYLDGTNMTGSTIGNLSDGDGKLSVIKTGSGIWTLSRSLTFSGSLDVREGTLVVSARRAYEWFRFKLLNSYSNGQTILVNELALYDADGNSLTDDTVYDDFPSDWSEKGGYYEKFPSWHICKPGHALYGKAQKQYLYYPNQMLGNLFDGKAGDAAAKDRFDVLVPYNVYCADPSTHIPIVFRLREGSAEAVSYDVSPYGSSNNSVASFELEGSLDGIRWEKLHGVTNLTQVSGYARWGSDDTIVTKGAVRKDKGWAISAHEKGAGWSQLANVSSVSVASGATLCADGVVTLKTLSLDCAAGGGRVRGFQIAENGTLNLTNVGKGRELELPINFSDCSSFENLTHWAILVDGRAKTNLEIRMSGDKLMLCRPGLVLVVR